MKKFSVAEHILKRPITVIMGTLIVIGFGTFSLTNLKVTLYPSFEIPVLAISTSYQDVAPEDMTNLIVEPIESAVSAIEGIDTMTGNISKGSAFIILRLHSNADIRRTELKVREALDRIRNELPSEASEPVIFQFDPENQPVMRLSLQASSTGLDELRDLSLERIEPQLERIDGVAAAETRGGLDRQIFVNVDPMSLAQYKLVPSDIESALRQNNAEVPIGDIISGPNSYSVRAMSMFGNTEQIEQTIIKRSEQGIPIRIRDVAEVEDSFAKISTLVEINGQNSISLDIQKASDANTLDVTNAVIDEIQNINQLLPPDASLQVQTNDGDNIEQSISNLSQSALAALVVVIIILLLFMGGWRIALVVAASIPVSIMATFAAMYGLGLTLNILTITALALAIGLLVDNAIVVSESIARKLEEGIPKFESALQGTNEVIGALMGATLTTLGVFIPIVGLSSVQAQLFVEFALTISIAIAISFIASIILVPVLSLLLLSQKDVNNDGLSFRGMRKLEEWYANSMQWLLFKKWMVVPFVLLIFGGIYVVYQQLETEFFPQSESNSVSVDIELPQGTKLVHTADITHSFSQQIQEMEEVESVVTQMGQSGYRTQTNTSQITANLVNQSEREVSSNEFALRLRQQLQAPGVEVNVRGAGGGGFGGFGGNEIQLSLIGSDSEVLQAISNKIEQIVLQDENVISVDNGRTDPIPELQFQVDRQRISRTGSSLNEVAQSLKTQTQGTRVGFYRDEGREVPIFVQVSESALINREQLSFLELIQIDGQRIPLASLGRFESIPGMSSISRRDRETTLDVSIQVDGNINEYRERITDIIRQEVVLPEGYRFEFTGQLSDADQGMSEMNWALLAAIILTYMIMASLFENFRDPFVIFFTIPLAFFGAFAGLFIFNTPIGVTAFIGIFMLVGIIVNNGIVLVDYIHLYTKNNEFSDSLFNNVVEACKRRMRPILLTALTTICSMIPLATGIGTGAEIWSPLARAVIGGLFFGTILTLYVIPLIVMGISKKRRKAILKHRDG